MDAGVFTCIAEMSTVYHSQREQRVEYGQASVKILDRCTVTEVVHSWILIGAELFVVLQPEIKVRPDYNPGRFVSNSFYRHHIIFSSKHIFEQSSKS